MGALELFSLLQAPTRGRSPQPRGQGLQVALDPHQEGGGLFGLLAPPAPALSTFAPGLERPEGSVEPAVVGLVRPTQASQEVALVAEGRGRRARREVTPPQVPLGLIKVAEGVLGDEVVGAAALGAHDAFDLVQGLAVAGAAAGAGPDPAQEAVELVAAAAMPDRFGALDGLELGDLAAAGFAEVIEGLEAAAAVFAAEDLLDAAAAFAGDGLLALTRLAPVLAGQDGPGHLMALGSSPSHSLEETKAPGIAVRAQKKPTRFGADFSGSFIRVAQGGT